MAAVEEEDQQQQQLASFCATYVESCSSRPSNGAGGAGDQEPPVKKAAARRRKRRSRAAAAADGDDAVAAKKRRLNDDQVKFLETKFDEERKLETGRKVHLAAELGLDPKQVAVWFQNRRARHKSKLIEEEFRSLRALHDAVVAEKTLLQNEVDALRARLSEVEDEMANLAAATAAEAAAAANAGLNTAAGAAASPSSSSISYNPLVDLGGFEAAAELPCISDCGLIGNYMIMDLVNLYGMI